MEGEGSLEPGMGGKGEGREGSGILGGSGVPPKPHFTLGVLRGLHREDPGGRAGVWEPLPLHRVELGLGKSGENWEKGGKK